MPREPTAPMNASARLVSFSCLALSCLASSCLFAAPVIAQQAQVPALPGVPKSVQQAADSIDAEKIRAHVRFLASDLLEGRGPGVRGGNIAAEYIATQFALDGLKPAGDNGTYFQNVPLYAVHTVEDQTSFSFVPHNGAPIPLTYGQDVVTKDETGQESADIDAPIVFVGYGIDAPEYHWDDYAGVDVKGKVLLVIVNEPPSDDPNFFKGKALTYYGRWTYKYEEAARKGAVGVLIIHRTDLASYGWDVVRNSQSVEKSFLEGDPTATLRAASWIQLDVAQKLMSAAGLNVDQEIDAAGKRGFHPIELPVRLRAHIASRVRHYNSPNVIAAVAAPTAAPNRPSSTRHTTTTSGSTPISKATTSTTGLPITAPDAAFSLNWPEPGQPCILRTPFFLPPSPQKSRACSARSTSACTRPFLPDRSRLI